MARLPFYAAGITASFMILLTAAAAQDAALLKQAQEIFQPLPQDLASTEFPITRERVELGRSLFFDPRLTIDGNMSCSSCHQPAFTEPTLARNPSVCSTALTRAMPLQC